MTMVIRLVPIATAVFLTVVSGPAYARFGGHYWGDGLEPTGGRRSCTCLRGRRQVLSHQWPVSRCTPDTNTTDSEASLPNALMSK